MHSHAQPRCNFYVQVPVEIDRLRRQLQNEMGLSGPELVSKAIRLLADHHEREPQPAEAR